MLTYVIGDIHGNLIELEKLIDILDKHKKDVKEENPKYIFVGDYINKGKQSKEVVDFLINFSISNECIFLTGNHEYKLMSKDINFLVKYGGIETIKSYTGKNIVNEITLEETFKIMKSLGHYDFFNKLFLCCKLKNYFIFHAGYDTNYNSLSDVILHNKFSFFFSRNKFILSMKKLENSKIIFGHTSFMLGYADNYKIGIDTGAAYGGNLTSFCIEKELFINSNNEFIELTKMKNIGGEFFHV